MSGRDRYTNVPLDIEHRGEGQVQVGPRGPGGFGTRVSVGGGIGGGVASGYQLQPPWIARPPSATDFQLQATLVAQTAANTPGVFGNIVQIPQGNVAVIRSVALLANNLLITSSLFWTIRFDQAPAPGWNLVTISPRSAGSVEVSYGPDETYIHVPEGRSIDVAFQVVDAGTYQVSVSLHGWFYSVALYEAARAAYGGP